MSTRHTAAVWELSGISATEKLVLLALADDANYESGECWRSQGRIAERCGLSRQTLNRSIKSLVSRGLLTSQRNFDSDGRQKNNTYWVNIDNGVSQCVTQGVSRSATPIDPLVEDPKDIDIYTPKVPKPQHDELSAGFEAAWSAYPKRSGGHSKQMALAQWRLRRKSGISAEAMTTGIQTYAEWCRSTGKTGTAYVMQAQRFLGRERFFDNALEFYGVRAGNGSRLPDEGDGLMVDPVTGRKYNPNAGIGGVRQ